MLSTNVCTKFAPPPPPALQADGVSEMRMASKGDSEGPNTILGVYEVSKPIIRLLNELL